MRTEHSLKNITISIFSQVVIVLLGFLSRKVFLDSLGANYLGVNGLLTNVLSIMALVEGGIGISIVYNLYKPLAENDRNKIIALVQLYKKAYGILAILILIISIVLYPFLGNLMKDSSPVSYLSIIYILFVAKNMISYLNAHKWSLINADQRGYMLARTNLIIQIITMIARIILLLLTQNYILYLVVELLFFALQNIINGRIVNKRYPYIKTKVKYSADKETIDRLVINVKAMFLHNIGGYLVFGTDNILISTFVNVATVGIYSNYTMITQQVSALVKPILGGIGDSVGNLIATESKEKNYSVFKVSYLVNFWLYALCVVFLYNLLEPFISWWLGKQYLLNHLTLIFILVNFYLDGMRTAISTYKNKAGLFVQDKYAPLIEGGINLISSIILVKYYGIAGIIMGTTISTIATVLWTQPYIVYKHLFKEPVLTYFIKYLFYLGLTIFACFVTTSICDYLDVGTKFISLVIRGIICLIIPNILFVLILYKTNEFKYFNGLVNLTLTRVKMKFKKTKYEYDL
ncbi:lipopolysaccharide biosynthesis protein [Neobacillus cucumis]|uniref:lipopolysaccharide biosynthesis protein n=1 Tax=Neobacillus cucumis TaxID=1740721 RepID=UPI001963DABF|nr:oligosaccharide flippase family protein [Neobacillus cucumis]MBM7651848.1 O-antigen/teichoic acid export membrane protein [Neobacillus cucumis]